MIASLDTPVDEAIHFKFVHWIDRCRLRRKKPKRGLCRREKERMDLDKTTATCISSVTTMAVEKKDSSTYQKLLRYLRTELSEPQAMVLEELVTNYELLCHKYEGETELYACQVLESHEELESVQKQLRQKDRQLEECNEQTMNLQSDLRKVRKQLYELQSQHEEALQEERRNAQMQLSETKRTLEDKFQTQLQQVQASNDTLVETLRTRIVQLTTHTQSNSDQNQLIANLSELTTAKRTIQELENLLAQTQSDRDGQWEEEKEELLSEIDQYARQLQQSQETIERLQQDATIVTEFKGKLERADEDREVSERTIVNNYERKLSQLQLDHKIVLNKLRQELSNEKKAHAQEMETLSTRLQEHQVQHCHLQQELTTKDKEKDVKLFQLEATVSAQDRLLDDMKREMDQLQKGLEGTAARKRIDIDELSTELIESERKVKELRLQVEQQRESHASRVGQLEAKIRHLESLPSQQEATNKEIQKRVHEVKDRLEQLERANKILKTENETMADRLEEAEVLAQERLRQVKCIAKENETFQQYADERNKECIELKLKQDSFRDAVVELRNKNQLVQKRNMRLQELLEEAQACSVELELPEKIVKLQTILAKRINTVKHMEKELLARHRALTASPKKRRSVSPLRRRSPKRTPKAVPPSPGKLSDEVVESIRTSLFSAGDDDDDQTQKAGARRSSAIAPSTSLQKTERKRSMSASPADRYGGGSARERRGLFGRRRA